MPFATIAIFTATVLLIVAGAIGLYRLFGMYIRECMELSKED